MHQGPSFGVTAASPNQHMHMPRTPHVTILLATYQGARFLRQQLDSIRDQDFANWSLIISDDGSQDETRAIAREFAAQQPDGQVRLLDGPGLGATRNFLSMIGHVPQGSWLAFCDQDDVWLPEKLGRAVDLIGDEAQAALYSARTVISDDDLKPLRESRMFSGPFDFRNALVQACTAGNTCLANAAGTEFLRAGQAAAEAAGIHSHDWWAYQLISGAGGRIFWDPQPVVLYRQHHLNESGRNDTVAAMAQRISMLMGGPYGDWLRRNIAALLGSGILTDENARLAQDFRQALDLPGPAASRRMRQLGLRRQNRPGNLALYTAAATGRLRQRPASSPSK